jgi:hypothetical protein
MPEMILPGTYIEVRAEKLISAGPIAIGNVGIVGTARRGKLANPAPGVNAPDPVVYTPANIGEARDIFGDADSIFEPTPPNRELTLVRALELAFANGAQRVYAARVAAAGANPAVYNLPAGGSTNVQLTSVAPGDGYNKAVIELLDNGGGGLDVTITLSTLQEAWRSVPADAATFVNVLNGDDLGYNYRALSSTGGGSSLFEAAVGGATGDVQPTAPDSPIASPETDGTNGTNAIEADYGNGLAALEIQPVHIVVLAGQGRDMADTLIAHVRNASTDLMKHERIGVIGSVPSKEVSDLIAPQDDEGRLVFAGPGIKVDDSASGREATLAGTYTAAAVAGLISSLDPHASPTNKIILAGGLETEFNGTQLEQLVLNQVLALEQRNGSIRVVRGITSSTNTAWSQVTTRRIVDYARYGVRSAANPFIGKLNNERVREALKGSINGFLADMVDREMLISYELDVSATRAQQIRGIAQVTMVVRPTFSIDYIRVIMYLE